jgi:acylphosphatase
MQRVRLVLKGKVQAVGFRQFARMEADKLGITGYIRKMPDSSVVIVGEGEDYKLKKFIDSCKRGPLLAFVQSTDIQFKEGKQKQRRFEVML